ncbi:MAG: hypothetical protein GW821_19105 [Shewanella vesiculosa]|uniref:thiosulfate oxidation carrier complex protein SoxZ n=1 Tax=Shewanella vesiculosa TaxID=518738 RepID=UPI0023528152|nr:thiosulfate oxidation carrier complex protein SoxZ [Shewanella vesiculosa]NCP38719.1 hypothetical protein [Shewanella vesiculosa]NCQ47197.1 hypothetical protein [Shewanella frigidimarina]
MKINSTQRPIYTIASIALMLMPGLALAFFGLSSPELKGQLPNNIVEGNMVPIFVEAKNNTDDPVTSITVDVHGNPAGLQRAFEVRFEKPQERVFISSRIRMASTGNSNVTISATLKSGKQTTTQLHTIISKPTAFDNPDLLTYEFKGGYKFPTNEIGQTIVANKPIRGNSNYYRVSSMIYHPMLPSLQGSPDYYVNKMQIYIDGNLFATVLPTPAMSNNPFYAFDIDANVADKPILVEWQDTRGHSFKAEAK